MEDIKPDLLLSEFLDSLGERAEKHFKGHLHQAFIDWYVEAEFGHLKWEFTDGPNDGGIDAVVWRKHEDKPAVIVLQSKFSEKIDGQPLYRTAYQDFDRVVNAFRRRDETFDELLETVAPEIRRFYLKAFRALDGNWLTSRRAFRLITTLKRIPRYESKLLPDQNFVYGADILRLYRQFRRVWAPKAQELVLTVHDKLAYTDPKRDVTSYLFNARVSDFKKYLDHNDVGRLVARNIRYHLPGSVGAGIRRTYESAPHDFWYRHNGITIVCDDLEERNRKATLTMNVMLVAVRERTREIGVRKAIGAPAQSILKQFFFEALLIALISGGIGLIIAFGLCGLVDLLPMPDFFAGLLPTWQAGAIAFAVLSTIAIASALYPARRAAAIDPIEALRYEAGG